MEYISQLNAFYELLPSNPLGPKAICLYGVLLHINNKSFWKVRFTVANTYLMYLTGIDRRTLDRVRNELIQKNYIEYKRGKGNKAGEYKIIQLYSDEKKTKSVSVQNDTQIVTQNDTQSVTQCDHINIQDNNIFNNLLNKSRAKMKNQTFSSKLSATMWAKNQEEWNQLSEEEKMKFMSWL